ncbi:MAG: hypothetical protein HOI80_06185 [Alphaproteobacteria bacterium]|nr:hypothetical protein [Alphaproteobacteria bacterium]MBT5389633.1 hypothetical protein [Alphaproteobacteria bacterium]MBT5655063.1 hypothetical protein [Alphaproteobacteria bacterium]
MSVKNIFALLFIASCAGGCTLFQDDVSDREFPNLADIPPRPVTESSLKRQEIIKNLQNDQEEARSKTSSTHKK